MSFPEKKKTVTLLIPFMKVSFFCVGSQFWGPFKNENKNSFEPTVFFKHAYFLIEFEMATISEGDQENVPIPTLGEILACQFHSWYAIPDLQRQSIKSIIIDLPQDFVDYLASDGVILPPCAQDDVPKTVFSTLGGNDEVSDFDYTVSGDPEVVDVTPEPNENRPDFPALDQQLRAAVTELGGEIFCKTNWSAPVDAAWINANSLKCHRTADIYLLLKSSDRTTFDLEHMMEPVAEAQIESPSNQGQRQICAPERPTLILRKWANLNPAMEFRLFICGGCLTGICQRDVTTCYDFLIEKDSDVEGEGEKSRLCDLLLAWFRGTAADNEPTGGEWLTRALGLPAYSLDVYIDRRDRIFLIDVNVFGYPSDPLLFDWSELLPCSYLEDVPFRSVQSRAETKASAVKQGYQQGPIDVSLAPDFSRFMQIVQEQENEGSSSEGGD